MAFGERIKAARLMSGLNQRELAKRIGMSAMAISKYERGILIPNSSVLLKLGNALGVHVSYFFRRRPVALSDPLYRKKSDLNIKDERVLLARVQGWVERYLDIEELLGVSHSFDLPKRSDRGVASLDDVERVAHALRKHWKLGLAPIEGLIELLENRGIKVELFDGPESFDALTVMADGAIPVIVVKKGLPGDRQYFDLAHELGHLVLEVEPNLDEDKAAYRFAGAFLVPDEVAFQELGKQRNNLNIYELHMLKHKYRLSMQGWIYRAKDLHIINSNVYGALFNRFSREGWRRKEPGDQIAEELPQRFERLIVRALTEGVISPSRAAELLGKSLEKFWKEVAKQHEGLQVWST